MKSGFAGSLLCFVLFGFSIQAVATTLEQKVAGGVVQVFKSSIIKKNKKLYLSRATGTGFVINSDGYIATNNHVVERAVKDKQGRERIHINPEGQSVNKTQAWENPNASVIWRSVGKDLAIVKLDSGVYGDLKPLVFTTALPDRGGSVYAIGYPGAADRNEFDKNDTKSTATFTQGAMSRTYDGKWEGENIPISIVQHSSEISGGNSGGPLVDECGRVIGVNTSHSLISTTRDNKNIAPAPGVNYASQITELIEELDARNIPYSFSAERCLSSDDYRKEFRSTLIMIVVAGAVGFLLLGVMIVVFMRKPRQQIVHAIENVSRRFSNRDAAAPRQDNDQPVQPSTSLPSLILDGRDSESGQHYRIIVSQRDISQGMATIGRDPNSAQVVIDHPEVSRVHATITYVNGSYQISDNDSTNGTSVNGRGLARGQVCLLSNGDKLELGTLDLRVIVA